MKGHADDMLKGQLFQHILIDGGKGLGYTVEFDEDETTRKTYRTYNMALLHAIKFLTQSMVERPND